jgi:hypothetical protein
VSGRTVYAYAGGDPVNKTDPTGQAADTLFDIGFIAYSAVELARNPSWTNAVALGADVVGAAVPFVTGLGAGVRAGEKAAEAAKAGRGGNRLKPVASAEGPHSTFKRGQDGNISNTATYEPNPKNPSGFDEVKRVDLTGAPHNNPDGTDVPTPHVKERGQKGVRPAKPEEIPAPRQPRCEPETGTRISKC